MIDICLNIEAKQSDTPLGSFFLDHHSWLGLFTIGVLVTCVHFSGVQAPTFSFKETRLQMDPMSLHEVVATSYGYLHFGAAKNLGFLVSAISA